MNIFEMNDVMTDEEKETIEREPKDRARKAIMTNGLYYSVQNLLEEYVRNAGMHDELFIKKMKLLFDEWETIKGKIEE